MDTETAALLIKKGFCNNCLTMIKVHYEELLDTPKDIFKKLLCEDCQKILD